MRDQTPNLVIMSEHSHTKPGGIPRLRPESIAVVKLLEDAASLWPGIPLGQAMGRVHGACGFEQKTTGYVTPPLHGVFYNPVDSPRDHVAVFVVRVFRQDPTGRPSREIAERGFFSLDALPKETTPGTRRRLAEVLEGAPIGAKW